MTLKAVIELLVAIVVLVTALIGLNKADVIEVPVINEIPAFQPDGGNGGTDNGGEIVPPPEPTLVAVPDVRGLSVEEAAAKVEESGLVVVAKDPVQVCQFEQ